MKIRDCPPTGVIGPDDKEVADEKTDLYEVRDVFYVILKSGL